MSGTVEGEKGEHKGRENRGEARVFEVSGTGGFRTWVEILEGFGEVEREVAKFWEGRVKVILIYLVH
jgi:hypothetical protein